MLFIGVQKLGLNVENHPGVLRITSLKGNPMPCDLLVSYSRRDKTNGRVTDLIQQIEGDYRAFAGEDLRCFFDLSEINSMDDRGHRIRDGLRQSHLLCLT